MRVRGAWTELAVVVVVAVAVAVGCFAQVF
jgi:hypothetical protein